MKSFVLSFIMIITASLYAFSGNHIIYIDISSENNNMEETRVSVMSLLDSIDGESFLLLISNGTKPYVCESKPQVEKAFKDLSYGAATSVPDAYSDLDTLNALFTKGNLLSGVNANNRQLDKALTLHFFLEPEQADYYQQIRDITQKMLLINRLTNKEGALIEKCKVRIYFDCITLNDDKCQQYLKNYKRKYKAYEISTL